LVLSAAYTVAFNAAIRGVVLVGVFWYFEVSVTAGLLLAPVAVAMLIVLGLAIGLALTPLGILYSDVASALAAFTQLWFFLTPVVYPAPESYPLSLIATANPVSPLLTAARDLTATGTLTNGPDFFVTSALCVAGLLGAWAFYRIALPILTERMSA
jgi:lipopolysaccharide transport system permease protein